MKPDETIRESGARVYSFRAKRQRDTERWLANLDARLAESVSLYNLCFRSRRAALSAWLRGGSP